MAETADPFESPRCMLLSIEFNLDDEIQIRELINQLLIHEREIRKLRQRLQSSLYERMIINSITQLQEDPAYPLEY